MSLDKIGMRKAAVFPEPGGSQYGLTADPEKNIPVCAIATTSWPVNTAGMQ